ncbi:hypothetical protein MYP_4582 [Sporocytophaga myxococcoides]|uniref:Thiamine-phosphate synthase n=1 Tax=Sporocytophaga myxococcoides TaxID=153721 RepID=A0A098LM02_9BACT|nr:thiamine phosphate synthase [Sporocytophaga myxococcoides]GAL87352.1 hypothetical protein MYP_4582 [Sporocytophaga myxococcoides]
MRISRLHYITQDNIPGYTHAQLAEEACKGGADWVQLRVKGKGTSEWKKIAEETLAVCQKYNAKLIINDNVRIAKEIGADGVHLGNDDMHPEEAREKLGEKFIIGGTANTFFHLESKFRFADYIGLGPFRFTSTKEKLSPVLGAEGYKQILSSCKSSGIDIPIIAIGGIKEDDLDGIFQTGIYGVAIASIVNAAENKAAAMKNFIQRLEKVSLQ